MPTAIGDRRLHPDQELVARMAARDGSALDELMARHGRTAYAVALSILPDRARAEQAVTGAFMDAFCQAERFVPGELTVLAWLTSLTRRYAQTMAGQRS
jgi:RNA polymerase sigma-70 factor (ECF subfamily)